MSPLITYQNKLLYKNNKLANNLNCCCDGKCCVCLQFDSYITYSQFDERNKTWAGLGSVWQCVRYFLLAPPDDTIIVPVEDNEAPPPGSIFLFTECSGGWSCRAADHAWDVGLRFNADPGVAIKVNEGSDNNIAEPWERGDKYAFCLSRTKENCERCRDYDPEATVGGGGLTPLFTDPCGFFHITNRKCKPDGTVVWNDSCNDCCLELP
jgi:hypothetical protein